VTAASDGTHLTDRAAAVATTSRASTIGDMAPVALVVLAEAAWISVLAGLCQEFAFRPPVLGIPAFAGFVLVGIVAARLLGRRLGGRWPIAALGLIVIGASVGWLASEAARTALGDGLGPAIAAHPGGWLAGLAVLRGFAHARLPLLEDTVTRLISIGVPGLAILAIAGGVISQPFRAQFLADTMSAAVVFIVAATLATALARLTAVGSDAGFDWRRNPAWLGLALMVLAIAIVTALPLSAVAGTVIQVLLSVVVAPLVIVALVAGFDRTALRVVVILVALMAVVYLLVALIVAGANLPAPPAPAAGSQDHSSVAEQVITLSLGGLLLLAAIIGIVVLAAAWMRRTRPPVEDLVEESRTIDQGTDSGPPRRPRRRFGRRLEPTAAAAAYVALVADLDHHPDVRRDPAETPAEHASRLRATGRPELSLDLLAADYALVRYGDVTLSPQEDRRAIGRWRILRRRIPRTGR